MPGAAVMSKLDSSSTMMMCGGLLAGRQVSPERGFRRSAAAASASKKPRPISSDTATTPERAKLEMWVTPENGWQGSSGTMLASPAMPASETAAPKLDVRRRGYVTTERAVFVDPA